MTVFLLSEDTIPIKIIPFPTDGNNPPAFLNNNLTITTRHKISDDNDTNHECNYRGNYIVNSSSEKNNTKKSYNAFNNDDSYWESSDITGIKANTIYNVVKGKIEKEDCNDNCKNTYTYNNYAASYYNSQQSSDISDYINIDNIQGEWIQIQLPNPVFLYSYCIKVPSNNTSQSPLSILKYDTPNDSLKALYKTNLYKKYLDNNISYFPKIFMLVGSNDGKKWSFIDQQSLVDSPELEITFNEGYCYDKNNYEMRIQVNSIKHFSYFRLIVSGLFAGNKSVKIKCLSLFGFIRFPVQNESTLGTNLKISSNLKNKGFCESKESFSGITNSQEYLSGMDFQNNNNFSNDYNNNNSTLLNKYKDLKDSINNAKNNTNYLPNLKSYDIFTKQIFENFDNKFKVFTVNSGSDTIDYDAINIINDEINPLIQLNSDYINSTVKMNENINHLDSTLNKLSNNINYVSSNDIIYDYNNTYFDKVPNLTDGRLTDNKEYIIQQNSLLILSTITITTLILALFLVYK